MARPICAALLLVLALPVAAEFRVCRVGGRPTWTERTPCDEIVMHTYQCEMVPAAPCIPPPKLTLTHSPAPFSVEVTFGGEFLWHGEKYWRFMRNGQVHFVTQRFFLRQAGG